MYFHLPTKIYCGKDSADRLGRLKESKIMICADPFLKENSALQASIQKLEAAGKEVILYMDIVPDAPMSKIQEIMEVIQEKKMEVLVAIGGGSALDATKSARFFYEKIFGIRLPLIAIPTTSGTGSEVTSYVVIKDGKTGKKTPVVDEKILPDIAILDPTCVGTMPASVARDTGLDVLTHALESLVSKPSNVFTATYAKKAIETVFEDLKKAILEDDAGAKERMHYASTMAGVAFGQSGLGINHSLAHAVGGKFSIPHGRINGVLLPYVIQFHGSHQEDLYDDMMEGLGIEGFSPERRLNNFLKDLKKLRKDLDLPNTIRDLGIEEKDFNQALDGLVDLAIKDPCTESNPIEVTREDLKGILEAAYYGHSKKRVYAATVIGRPSF